MQTIALELKLMVCQMQTPDSLEFLNFLTKDALLHQTTLYGKNLMKTNSSLILEVHLDGELGQKMA